MKRPVLISVVAALMAACNRGSTANIPGPTPPIPTAPQTVYTGTITDSVSGAGTLIVSVGTSGSSVGGTWLAAYPGQNAKTRFVSGTVSGTSYSATVSDCVQTDTSSCFPNCRQTFTGTLTSGALSGSYAEVANDTCTPRSGGVSATRQ